MHALPLSPEEILKDVVFKTSNWAMLFPAKTEILYNLQVVSAAFSCAAVYHWLLTLDDVPRLALHDGSRQRWFGFFDYILIDMVHKFAFWETSARGSSCNVRFEKSREEAGANEASVYIYAQQWRGMTRRDTVMR
jgi:hypothetical protein